MTVPQEVLAEALRGSIGDATLRAAVLTTFTLEWAFTLDEVLPTFVAHSLSAAPNARREEVADHLLTNQAVITVYADAQHIGDDARATRVPMSVVPVNHPTGFFHPKVILALVEEAQVQRLIVFAGSANLTRRGWWEWVECGQTLTLAAGERTWVRDDLLAFLDHLDANSIHPADQIAPAAVREFLAATRQRSKLSGADGDGLVRFLWNGAAGRPELTQELTRFLGSRFAGGKVEVVSPWYSDTGDRVLLRLRDGLDVAETVAFVPQDPDGAALLPPEAVSRLGTDVAWGSLPRRVLSSGPTPGATPRHVHAKLYRLTRRGSHEQAILAGSFNLTDAAFQSSGNVEAGLLIELPIGGKEVWLEPRDAPTQYHAITAEEEAAEVASSSLSLLRLTYDWQTGRAQASWAGGDVPVALELRQGAWLVLTLAEGELSGPMRDDKAAALATHLRSSSPFLSVLGTDGADLGYTIVHERGVEWKPSPDVERRLADALADLLLSVEARRGRVSVAGGGDDVDPDKEVKDDDQREAPTAFDTFAALFQAMDSFRREVLELVAADRQREVHYRLVGQGARCLGDVLTTAQAVVDEDAATALVVCWAVEDLIGVFAEGLAAYGDEVSHILRRTDQLRTDAEDRVRDGVSDDPELTRFLSWARKTFVRTGA